MKWIFLLILVVSIISLVIGMIDPSMVNRKSKKPSRRIVLLIYGVGIVIGLSGFWGTASIRTASPTNRISSCPDSTQRGTDTGSANESNRVTTNHTNSKPSSRLVKKPMTRQQMISVMQWTNDQYEQVYSAYQGLPAGSQDESFTQLEIQVAQALSAKGDSINSAIPKPIPPSNNTWWLIENDVDQTTNFALAAASDMALYIDGSGDASQVKQDISDYQHIYTVTMQEIKQGIVLDK